MVLDHDKSIALIDKALEDRKEFCDIIAMEPYRRFIEKIKSFSLLNVWQALC